MDAQCEKRVKPPHPRKTANFLSALTFTWLFRTFWTGWKRVLEIEDLYEPLKEHKSDYIGDIFERKWAKELKKSKSPKLLSVIVQHFLWQNLLYSFFMAVYELFIRLLQPFFIGLLVRYLSLANADLPPPSDGDPTYILRCAEILTGYSSRIGEYEALFFAFGILVINLLSVFFNHNYAIAMAHQGMRARVGCCSLIYRKALKLSKTALRETTVGQVVNLLSNDVNRLDAGAVFLHYLWLGPVVTVIISYFTYLIIGWSTFLGVGFMLLLIPFQAWLAKKTSAFRLKTAMRTDERVRLMNEIISGMQVIKMYTWELPFANLVKDARGKELREIQGAMFCRSVVLSFIVFTTRVCMFLTLITYALTDNTVTAQQIFVLASFYTILRQTMTVNFAQGMGQVAEVLISIKRLQDFLLYDENPVTAVMDSSHLSVKVQDKPKITKVTPHVVFDKVSCYWTDEKEPTLNNISCSVQEGQLLAVIGPVGAGKSSLIQAVLKELQPRSGSLSVQGVMSYASQEPWLFAGSVRQNILFGLEYDKHRYQKVIEVCALKRDFELFPYGDKTIVGERGTSLSGGQRARINLARAVYKPADIYLLDDPLSAVDTHVGKHLFEDCVRGFLRGKTVLLVTHQLQYLKDVPRILILKNGVLEAEGSFEELQSSCVDFAQLLREPASETELQMTDVSAVSMRSHRSSTSSGTSQLTDEDADKGSPVEVAEQRSDGSVGGRIYSEYFKACKNWLLVSCVFVLFIITQVTSSGADYWQSKWSQEEELNHSNKTNMTEQEINDATLANVYIYTGISITMVITTLVRSVLFFYMCITISRNLHNNMFSKITRAVMRFFLTNPSGRILNRFSKDMGSVDELLPQAAIDFFQIFLMLLGIVIVVATASPIILAPTAVVAVIFYFLRVFCLKTSVSIKRLEGVTRSPVFSHLNATLQGLTTIRAFNAQDILTKEFDSHQDLHSTAWYIFICTSRAFGFWLDSVCLLFVTAVTFTVLYSDNMTGADAGLAITQAITLTSMFQWGMRQSAEMENQMTSVERVLEYTEVEQEPALESSKDNKPPPSWPSQGMIEFANTSLRYDPEGEPVLHGVSFTIRPQEKIGIVGRTGAGKSSLISALFRLAYIEGKIKIDSVETSSIGLHDLRSKVSIIPQEPVIFSGTLRKNLDPFDEYQDLVLWQALEEVELKEAVKELPNGLSSQMTEGGTNFSVGQRQLVCLARAIIRNNRILIMDEATANVDPQTDNLIQRTIRRKFNDCTVLTIAHRLNTVMDSDRILVLDAGRVMELQHPHLLLQDNKSMFYGLVQETGKATAKKLKSIAKENYKSSMKTQKLPMDQAREDGGSLSKSSSLESDLELEEP